jgi:hypothetical protein
MMDGDDILVLRARRPRFRLGGISSEAALEKPVLSAVASPYIIPALAPGHDIEQALGPELADSNSGVTYVQRRRPEKASFL